MLTIFFFKKNLVGQLSHCHILVKLKVWHFCKLLQWQESHCDWTSLSHHFKSYISTKNVDQFFFKLFLMGQPFYCPTIVTIMALHFRGQKSHHWNKCPFNVTDVPKLRQKYQVSSLGQKCHPWDKSPILGTKVPSFGQKSHNCDKSPIPYHTWSSIFRIWRAVLLFKSLKVCFLRIKKE